MMDTIAFVVVQMEGQLQRIRTDENFFRLSDDSKLAVGGMEQEVRMLRGLLKVSERVSQRDSNIESR